MFVTVSESTAVQLLSPTSVIATEPNSFDARQLLQRLGVDTVESNQFLCHTSLFAQFSDGKKSMKMEDFYRWQRKRLGYLMDDDKPVGGEWNFDKDNREPPPKTDTNRWPQPLVTPLDNVDNEVLASLPSSCWGAPPNGLWATSRKHALQRLDHFITQVLPSFGPQHRASCRLRSIRDAFASVTPSCPVYRFGPGLGSIPDIRSNI
jgi:deoxyribodipyrimidine photolyase-related protein